MLNLLGERLIDLGHWKRGTEQGVWPKGDFWTIPEPTVSDPERAPYLGYGQGTFDHWKSGTIYVLENSSHFPTMEDYKKVHARTFFNEPGEMFWSYYRYQIWANYPEAERPALYELLDKAQNDPKALNELIRKKGLKNGRGVLRTVGDTSWSGKPWNVETNSFELYSQKEFDQMARNAVLRPEVRRKTEEGIEARFWHPAGPDVEKLLDDLFTETHARADHLLANRKVLGSEYRKEAIALAADFYRRLVLIHGFWDGIGRSSKQMRDWVLRYMGLQVPADTPEDDMELTDEEYRRELERGITQTETKVAKLLKEKSVREILGKPEAPPTKYDVLCVQRLLDGEIFQAP